MLVIDQATADYAEEQGRRAVFQDSQARELELAETFESEPTFDAPECAECINWRPAQNLYRADGSTVTSSDFCSLRASAELEQMSQDYASQCRFFVEDIPF